MAGQKLDYFIMVSMMYLMKSTHNTTWQFTFTTSNEGGEQMSSFALRPSDDVAKVECHAALPRDSASPRVHSMPRRLAAGSFTVPWLSMQPLLASEHS
jgi:hypothetical protein